MNGNEFLMYSQNRYTGFGMSGFQGGRGNQQAFELATSAHYRQFHEMKAEMPSDVIQLFKANEVNFVRAPRRKKCRSLDPTTSLGINLIQKFEIPNLQLMEEERRETKDQKKLRWGEEKAQKHRLQIQQKISKWNPFEDENITSDPEKTLLVARLNYKTTEKNLKFQFEKYGIIKSVKIVRDLEGNSRGYGFVEFDSKSDFVNAYKQANNRKIDGRKVIVDFEKGRTILRWRPRRFGEGQGTLRLTKEERIKKQNDQRERQQKRRKEHRKQQRSRSRSARKEKKNDEKEKKKEKRNSKQKKEKKKKKEKKEKKERNNKMKKE